MHDHDRELQSNYSHPRRKGRQIRPSVAIPAVLILVILTAGAIALCNRPEAPAAGTDTDTALPPVTDVPAPAPEPIDAQPEAPPPTVVVTADALRLRASPPDGAILALAPQGQELQTTGQRQQAGGREWLEVWLPDGSGTAWAAADYLQ